VPADSVSIRIYSGIARFPCDSMAFLYILILPRSPSKYDQKAEARRLRRHNISSPPTAGPRCHICDKICASDFGLPSHLRIHNRPSSTS